MHIFGSSIFIKLVDCIPFEAIMTQITYQPNAIQYSFYTNEKFSAETMPGGEGERVILSFGVARIRGGIHHDTGGSITCV